MWSWRGCVSMTWCPDEIRRSWALLSFFDANSVERVLNAKALRLLLVFWDVSVLPDFLVVSLAILGSQRVWPLILSLFGKNRWLISRVSVWHLELGFDQRLTPFSKESNEIRLFWSSISIKLDGLRMLEVRRPITNFSLLVFSNATPGNIYGSPWVL